MASLLTPLQRSILHAFFGSAIAREGYFLTGGTALAEYYLHHRKSEDLDFFTRNQRAVDEDARAFRTLLEERAIACQVTSTGPQFARLLASHQGEETKIEFALDKVQLAPTQNFDDVVVDSYEDIAVNKVCCILSRSEPKDYIDLYLILVESEWSLEYLLSRAVLKEAAFEDPRGGHLVLAANLESVKSVNLLGLMLLRPIDEQAMRNRLRQEAAKIRDRFAPRGPSR